MRTFKPFATIAFLAVAICALAQQTPTPIATVTISAKGDDVRGLLHEMFAQQKKSYVLDSNVKATLFLSLRDVDFEEALLIVCKAAGLAYEIQNGVFYITKAPMKVTAKPAPKPEINITGPTAPITAITAQIDEKPRGILPGAAFQKRVTTKLEMANIREVFAELSKQTGVPIEVDKSVPNYKLDAYLSDTSLKFAIDAINRRSGLEYKLTSHRSILIYMPKKDDLTRVQVISEGK